MKKIKVFVVDDHPVYRSGLIINLKDIPKIKVVGQAANGQEFLEKIEQMGDDFPDVVFMDIRMDKMNGIEATKIACRQHKDLRIIILTEHDEDTYIEHMKHLGAKGFMNKMIYPDELEEAIHDALENKFYVSKSLLASSNTKVTKDEAYTPHTITKADTPDAITKREMEVLKLLVQGMTAAEIAEKIHLSKRTIEKHISNLLNKTDTKNSSALIVYAIKNKIIEM